MVQPNLGRIAPVIRERFLPFLLAQHYDRSLAHVYGQRAEAMLLTAPPWPRDDLRLIPQTRPPALWQVELDVIVFGEDGRLRRRTAGRTQAMRSAHARAVHGLRIQVGYEAPVEPDGCAQHGCRTLRSCIVIVNEPGNTVRARPVQARVRAQQPESHPPLVDPRWQIVLEPANVAGPEAQA
ncbi:hypothetical protein BDV40DRAFT_295337 [Aspergillus tamarii]|uniref:Uncharacterized protein n=1 Tax=Aspergillus tamarii TaxID=41984 RepID=A0A5N6VCZ7_ASPTM|nr:hypothetical protein BDV40DRAFT_295337 [Aspergillus tamarii]